MNPKLEPDPSTQSNLFAKRLSSALAERGLPLARVQAKLQKLGHPISVASLSYWSTGRSLPSRSRSYGVVRALEGILKVEEGYLTEAVTLTPQEYALATVMNRQELVSELLQEHQLPDSTMFERDAVALYVTIDRDSCERSLTTRIVLRAAKSGAQKWAIVVERVGPRDVEASGDATAPLLRQIRIAPDLTALEFGLNRPLERGEAVLAEHRIRLPAGNSPVQSSGVSLRAPSKFLSLHVEFLDESPSQVFRTFKAPGSDARVRVDQPPLFQDGVAHCVVQDVAAGQHAIAWEW